MKPANTQPTDTADDEFSPRPMTPRPMTLAQALRRCARLRCPVCGEGKLFRGWFAMHAHCSGCHLTFDRGPGYYLGSIYFNYFVTTVLLTAGYLGLWLGGVLTPDQLLWIATAFTVIFPAFFFRWARAMWITFDQWIDPAGEDAKTTSGGRASDS